MKEYKTRYPTRIYSCNYDSLVSEPKDQIKTLISWLDFKWDASYLSPHLNSRTVSTASNVQIRSPINSKSLGGWRNYKEMLQPAIDVLTKSNKYRNLVAE